MLDSATPTSDEESDATSEERSDLSGEEDTAEKEEVVRTLDSSQFTQTHDVLGEWERYTTVSIVFFDCNIVFSSLIYRALVQDSWLKWAI